MKVYVIKTLYSLSEPNVDVSADVELYLMKEDAEKKMSAIISNVESTVREECDYEDLDITHEKTTDGEYYEIINHDENNCITVTLELMEVK